MSYQQFGNFWQHSAPEGQEQQHLRNGLKRPRGYSPQALDYSNNVSVSQQATKRMRISSDKGSPVCTSNNINSNNGIHGGLFLSKSDDEVSLAEEAQTTPTALPQHSISMQDQRIRHYQQQATKTHEQQPQSHAAYHQPIASSVGATNPPSGNRSLRQSGTTTYATDYQPMNSLLGNLHLMRQQQQKRRQANAQAQVPQVQTQTRDHSAMAPPQQRSQTNYHRHYGNYHSVPTTTTSTNNLGQGSNRSRRNTVSLRVTSNLS